LEANDNEIIFGEISPKCLIQLDKMIQYTYEPMIKNMSASDWGQCEEEIREEYLSYVRKFASEVQDSIQSMAPGQELFQLDPEEQQRLNVQGQDIEKLHFFERKFSQWLTIISNLLNDDSDTKKEPADAGPKVELEYWRVRMQKITNWCEQLKNKDFQTVKNLLFRQ
jgi:dynein heavy chain, axonemal